MTDATPAPTFNHVTNDALRKLLVEGLTKNPQANYQALNIALTYTADCLIKDITDADETGIKPATLDERSRCFSEAFDAFHEGQEHNIAAQGNEDALDWLRQFWSV